MDKWYFFLGDLTLNPKKQHQISCLESSRSEKERHIESERPGGGGGWERRGGERERSIRRLRDLTLLLDLHQRNKIWLLLFVCMYVLGFPYRWSAWVMVIIIIIKGLRSTASSGW